MAQHLKIKRSSSYFSAHTHSRYSFNDALPDVAEIVKRAHELGYPALGMTDHGNMAASVQLYMECRKYGIKPMPGSELYLVKDRGDKRAKRYHIGVLAYTTQGYRNLIHLSTLSHQNFHHKPLLDLADLSQIASEGRSEGLALLTGCYFGIVIQTLVNDGYAACKQLVATLAGWFDTYVEIQAHNIDHEYGLNEEMIARLLHRIARELGLPVVITQDSHYVNCEDKTDHETLKELVSWSTDADDAKFPGDGFHMVDEQWMREHHLPEIYEDGIAGLQHLLSKWDMHIPEMDEYHFKMPHIHPDPEAELSRLVTTALAERGLGRAYVMRAAEESSVINAAGMADYLLMVAEICHHMREVKMFFQIRGSAAGSVVCWLLGINEHDPIKWDLRFDRFLTKDRTKPPDIDIDIEHDRRKELMEWIATQWSVVQICSWGTYSLNGESDKGSLRIKYLSRMRKVTGQADWKTAPEEDKRQLYRLSDLGLISNPGVHAAGLVITSSSEEMDKYVPRQWIASSKTWVSQYDMKDVEKIGLVKLDVLGVKMLSVLRRAILNMGLDPADGLGFIPYNDRKTYAMLGKGDTAAVFQLEGYTSQKHVQRLSPRKLDDVIAAMALFRPGVMKSGAMDSYLRRRHHEEKLPKRHQIISEATDFTYGILLYQDQVIAVLRALGMNTDDLNKYLNAVKASNKNVAAAKVTMERLEPEVRELCFKAGMTDEDYAWLQEALKAFADYSFNRAHATVYGITAYRCAWLAKNHSLEYHAAVLSVAAGTDKEDEYKRVTRSRGLRILKPDVNASKATYTVDPKTQSIRKGLLAIDGVGPVVAREIEAHQPYRSVEDLCERVNPTKVSGSYAYLENKDTTVGKLAVLFSSGAMRSLIGG